VADIGGKKYSYIETRCSGWQLKMLKWLAKQEKQVNGAVKLINDGSGGFFKGDKAGQF
jgi:hypothetical protein